IVAIHGLDGDPEWSFTASNGVLWLRDLLPTSIPTARVLTYGYDARTQGVNRSQQTLYDLSVDLIAKLSTFRVHTNTEKRPLIFVAHSFGGILLKYALIHANAANTTHLPKYKAIELSTYGIIFLGTPHQGVNLRHWTQTLLQGLSTRFQTNDLQLKHLGLHSESLQQQIAQYSAISWKYHTIFCYETYHTIKPGGLSHIPADSATVPGAIDTEVIAIHKSHIDLIQFHSAKDNDYAVLAQILFQMTQKAPSNIHKNWQK
ncbi:hypothetical protein BU17DRAFT_7170, partial [Hysterangium stoloniferum]